MEEKRDVNLLAIAKFAAGLAVLAVVVHALMWWQLEYYIGSATQGDRPRPPIPDVLPPAAPPEPRLRTAPPADVRAMRAGEDRTLRTYGWIDREHGIVRIPIDRAIELTAERGLPSR